MSWGVSFGFGWLSRLWRSLFGSRTAPVAVVTIPADFPEGSWIETVENPEEVGGWTHAVWVDDDIAGVGLSPEAAIEDARKTLAVWAQHEGRS